MIGHETLTSVLFRFINFGVLISLTVYFFRKYVLQSLRHQVDEQLRHDRSLEELHRALEYQKEELQTQIASDAKLVALLNERVMIWTSKQHAKEKHKERVQREREHILMAHAQVQAEYLKAELSKKEIVPVVLQETEKELKDYFSEKKNGEKYLAHVISHVASKERS